MSMSKCWAYDGGRVCGRPAVGVDEEKGYTVCKYHLPPRKPYYLPRVMVGDPFRVTYHGKVFKAGLVQATAHVPPDDYPVWGWYDTTLFLRGEGRLWRATVKSIIDFSQPLKFFTTTIGPGNSGKWLLVAIPRQPLPVEPYTP